MAAIVLLSSPAIFTTPRKNLFLRHQYFKPVPLPPQPACGTPAASAALCGHIAVDRMMYSRARLFLDASTLSGTDSLVRLSLKRSSSALALFDSRGLRTQ